MRTAPAPYQCSSAPIQNTEPTTTYTPPVSKTIAVTDTLKPKLDAMAERVIAQVDNKYGTNTSAKIVHYKALIPVLQSIQSSSEELKDLVAYLIGRFEETLALLELENLLQIN